MFDFFLALLPSFLHVFLRRRLGAKIGKGTRIHFGTLLRARSVELGDDVSIGPFCIVQATALRIGYGSRVKPLTICSAGRVDIGQYVQIAPATVINSPRDSRSFITIGDHSRIFPFCWLEPGEGITIGKQVGVGGHTLIFTHGVWSDYLAGGPIAYGPVVLEDSVWLPWRVFILPNVVIGRNAIIGAGAVVNKSIPANALAAGTPARVLNEHAMATLTEADILDRARQILRDYAEYRNIPGAKGEARVTGSRLVFGRTIGIDDPDALESGDLLFLTGATASRDLIRSMVQRGVSVLDHSTLTITMATADPYLRDFVEFVRRYGIRLYVIAARMASSHDRADEFDSTRL